MEFWHKNARKKITIKLYYLLSSIKVKFDYLCIKYNFILTTCTIFLISKYLIAFHFKGVDMGYFDSFFQQERKLKN